MPSTGSSSAPPAGADGRRADVELRLPADNAYVSVLRTTTAGLAARLDFTIDSPTMILPLLRDGQLRGLAVSTSDASALVPGLPSLREAGVAGYDMTVWQVLFARPGTPSARARPAWSRPASSPPERDAHERSSFVVSTGPASPS